MLGMLLEFLNDYIDFRDNSQYNQCMSDDIDKSRKIEALKLYNAERQIKEETNLERKEKMEYLFQLGITDFSDI